MNIIIWILQIIVAFMFLMAGSMKTFLPKEKLDQKIPISDHFPMPVVRFIGVAELLGAIGIIVPWLTGISPVLTPVAASALAFVMVLAGIYHAKQKEYKSLPMNIGLFVFATLVAWFRFN